MDVRLKGARAFIQALILMTRPCSHHRINSTALLPEFGGMQHGTLLGSLSAVQFWRIIEEMWQVRARQTDCELLASPA